MIHLLVALHKNILLIVRRMIATHVNGPSGKSTFYCDKGGGERERGRKDGMYAVVAFYVLQTNQYGMYFFVFFMYP